MLTRSHITLGMLASMLAAGNAFAVSKEAQELMNIQSKMAPDQCELQRLSSQAAAAQRAGDRDPFRVGRVQDEAHEHDIRVRRNGRGGLRQKQRENGGGRKGQA